MFGAILGDIVGSPYEFDRGHKTKGFPLFSEGSVFTDDSVMTIAVADALMRSLNADDDIIRVNLIERLRYWGHKYWQAGYGQRFFQWLLKENPQPYNSYGNGSAMRVSSVAWLYHDISSVRRVARISAEITHNHPEGIQGECEFDYVLNRTCDEIRPEYHHVETCMETVPEAITAFLEGETFEDVIRTAVSLGGDSDTLTAIAGSIAEGYYGIPDALKEECKARLPEPLLQVVLQYENCFVVNT